jgi:hypothetical protein
MFGKTFPDMFRRIMAAFVRVVGRLGDAWRCSSRSRCKGAGISPGAAVSPFAGNCRRHAAGLAVGICAAKPDFKRERRLEHNASSRNPCHRHHAGGAATATGSCRRYKSVSCCSSRKRGSNLAGSSLSARRGRPGQNPVQYPVGWSFCFRIHKVARPFAINVASAAWRGVERRDRQSIPA